LGPNALGYARSGLHGKILYARYTFSYTLPPEADGGRAMFEGVAIMRLRDGRIADCREVANTGPGFVDMNFAPERIVKILRAREMRLRPALKPPGIWLKPHSS
jgi:hypothetical protein